MRNINCGTTDYRITTTNKNALQEAGRDDGQRTTGNEQPES
jgi:hypothetical protein